MICRFFLLPMRIICQTADHGSGSPRKLVEAEKRLTKTGQDVFEQIVRPYPTRHSVRIHLLILKDIHAN